MLTAKALNIYKSAECQFTLVAITRGLMAPLMLPDALHISQIDSTTNHDHVVLMLETCFALRTNTRDC